MSIKSSHQRCRLQTEMPGLQGKRCHFKRVQNTASALAVTLSMWELSMRGRAQVQLWGQRAQEPGFVSQKGQGGGGTRGGQRPVPQSFRQPWGLERPEQRCTLGFSTYNSDTCTRYKETPKDSKRLVSDWKEGHEMNLKTPMIIQCTRSSNREKLSYG